MGLAIHCNLHAHTLPIRMRLFLYLSCSLTLEMFLLSWLLVKGMQWKTVDGELRVSLHLNITAYLGSINYLSSTTLRKVNGS